MTDHTTTEPVPVTQADQDLILSQRWASSAGEWGIPDWTETDAPRRFAEQVLAAQEQPEVGGDWLRAGTTVYTLMSAGWRRGQEQLKNRFWLQVNADPSEGPEAAEELAERIRTALHSPIGQQLDAREARREDASKPTWRIAGQGSTFGPFVAIDGVQHDQVVLCFWRNQIQPIHLRLPGQAYVADLLRLMDEHQCNEVAIIPVRHAERVSITRDALRALQAKDRDDGQ